MQLEVKELRDAGAMGTPVSQPVRDLCAARLLTMSESMSKAPRPKPAAAAAAAAAQGQAAAAAAGEPEPQQKPSKRARKGDAAQPSAVAGAAEAPTGAEAPAQVTYPVLVLTSAVSSSNVAGEVRVLMKHLNLRPQPQLRYRALGWDLPHEVVSSHRFIPTPDALR